jgi:probable HAF family extracellular repeat protein
MRIRIMALLLWPLLLLTGACADQIPTVPQDAAIRDHGAVSAIAGTATATVFQILTLEGRAGRAYDINDHGVVAGVYQPSAGTNRAARWIVDAAGNVTGPLDLGSLPELFAEVSQVAYAVNDAGVIVGTAERSNGRRGGFIYDGEMRLLPWFVGDTYEWRAAGVNDHGVVVGSIEIAVRDEERRIIGRLQRGAMWLNSTDEPLLLPPLEGHDRSGVGMLKPINNSGMVVGYSALADGSGVVSVRWQVTGGTISGPFEIDPSDFLPFRANGSGDIAGFQVRTSGREAALLRAGTLFGLGTLSGHNDSEARDVNDAATAGGPVRVVGWSGAFPTSERPVVWTVQGDGTVTSLVDLGVPKNFNAANAEAINGDGWIVGASRHTNRGGQIATLWMPQQEGGGGGGGGCTPKGKGCK